MGQPSQPLLDPVALDGSHEPSRRRFLTALGLTMGAAALGLPPIPSSAAAGRRQSSDLGKVLNAHIGALRREGAVHRDEVTAWSVYDFTARRKLVSINEDRPLEAASMIKPFVAAAFFYAASGKGSRLRYTRRLKRQMEAMIRYSDNAATNRVMNLLGGPARVHRILKSHAPGIFRQTRVVERIPPGGRSYRNLASAQDYSRFLYALWYNRLPRSDEIKRLMHLPNRDRIYTGARQIPRGTRVYDKTGSTAHLCGNMGILVPKGRDGRDYPYTFIGIIQNGHGAHNYGRWISSRGDVIRSASSVVYAWLRQQHDLV
jgi:beta-lactamase class A